MSVPSSRVENQLTYGREHPTSFEDWLDFPWSWAISELCSGDVWPPQACSRAQEVDSRRRTGSGASVNVQRSGWALFPCLPLLSTSQYRFSLILATLISSWFLKITIYLGFPHGSAGKRIRLQCRRLVQETGFDPWVGKIPWRRERLPTPVFWPEELQGLHSPCGRKEPDASE